MEDTQQFRNRILKYTAVAAMVFWVISLPLIGLDGMFAAGLILGTLTTAINFVFLERVIAKAVHMEEHNAKVYILKNYVVRIVLYGIVFFLCWELSREAAIGCIAGLFTTKVAIYTDGFKNRERM